MKNEYSYSNDNKIAQSKTFLQVDITELKKTLTDKEKEKFWEALIDHHCFRGNETRMPLEQFYFSKENYTWDEKTKMFTIDKAIFNLSFKNFSKKINKAYSPSLVGYTVVRFLLHTGGFQLCHNAETLSIIDGFDSILLEISW